MENIKIVFLGTGSAIPTLSRNHNSIYFRYKERNFLVDCGEGTQRQMRKAKLNLCKITDILITHVHGDHIFGLPGLLHTMSKSEYNKKLAIYCPKNSGKIIKKFLESAGVHEIELNIKEVIGKFIENKNFSISSLELEHDVPCNGYIFEEKDKLRINKKKLLKYNIKGEDIAKIAEGNNIYLNNKKIRYNELTYKEKGRKISFVFDTKICSNVGKLVKDSDLAIVEGVFLGSEEEGKKMSEKYKHLTLEDAAKLCKKNKVKKLIISHISQRYEFKEKLLLKELKKHFKNSDIATDFMTIEI